MELDRMSIGETKMKRKIKGLLYNSLWLFGLLFATQSSFGDSSARDQWNSLSDDERQRLHENYNRWRSFSPEERNVLTKKFQAFKALPEPERDRVLENYHRFRRLPLQQRSHIRNRFRQFMKLPTAERANRMKALRLRRANPSLRNLKRRFGPLRRR